VEGTSCWYEDTVIIYNNQPRLFWRSDSKILSDWAAIFLEDSSLIVLHFVRWDCPLEVYRNTRKFFKGCYPQQILVTSSLSYFGDPIVNSSPIELKFLLEFSNHVVNVIHVSEHWRWLKIKIDNIWRLKLLCTRRWSNMLIVRLRLTLLRLGEHVILWQMIVINNCNIKLNTKWTYIIIGHRCLLRGYILDSTWDVPLHIWCSVTQMTISAKLLPLN